ncbi:hypothetical protein HMPREF0972_00623 [Actinomyces sp. oral taxon 848 str. F0332]|nr:hypothetical protein HMPREF0972_00623 [Actinomyces sp. oral taxon 848 str. F0332]
MPPDCYKTTPDIAGKPRHRGHCRKPTRPWDPRRRANRARRSKPYLRKRLLALPPRSNGVDDRVRGFADDEGARYARQSHRNRRRNHRNRRQSHRDRRQSHRDRKHCDDRVVRREIFREAQKAHETAYSSLPGSA